MNPRPGSRHEPARREDLLLGLLCEARHYLCDSRLQWDEHGGRRQRENKQEHADRISDYIEQNECLRNLIENIDEVLKGETS